MKLIFGSDHAGYGLRRELSRTAGEYGHQVSEVGATSEEAYDYPDASDAVAQEVLAQRADLGVLICGTGIGVSIRANRYAGIRAAVCCTEETAGLARKHNHANVLCLGSRITTLDEAERILRVFLETSGDPAERHVRRVNKLDGQLASI